MVNYFSLFLSILVLTMSITPCCYTDINIKENSTCICYTKCCNESDINFPISKTEKNESDFCSPFFTCGNCVGFEFHELIHKIFVPNSILNNIFSFYNLKLYSEYYNKLWHPPK